MTFNDLDKPFKKYNFFGILSNFDFNSYVQENLTQTIIKENVYIPIENDELTQIKTFKNPFLDFSKEFYHNSTYYKLNPEIVTEIFQYYLTQIKLFEIKKTAYFRNSIQTRTNGINDKIEVLKILKKCRSKLIAKSIDYVEELGDFTGIIGEEIRNDEYFNKIIYYSLSSQEIENYLSLKIINTEGVFLANWKKLQLQNIQIKFYNETIQELEDSNVNDLKTNIENNSLNKIIFKENAEKLFSFIVTKYPKQKNTAFFSYLYFFLKDKLNLLQISGNDNKDYREYIMNLYNIPFSRIQNTTSQNQYKKIEVFQLFEKYVTEYYSLENEFNLSNNE